MTDGIRKLYLAGPMTGLPEYNFPAFAAATARLRSLDYEVFSPHERDLEVGFDPQGTLDTFDLEAAMRDDLRAIVDADGIALLPGWQNSTGARIERFVAQTTGRAIFFYEESLPDNPLRLVKNTIFTLYMESPAHR